MRCSGKLEPFYSPPPLLHMSLQTHDLHVLKWNSQQTTSPSCYTPSASPLNLLTLPFNSSATADSSLVRRSSISLGSKRAKPYNIPSRSSSGDDSHSMMTTAPFEHSWNPSAALKARQGLSSARRTSDASYTLGNALGPQFNPTSDPVDMRPGSSHSSAASHGAHSHKSGSASPPTATMSQTYDVNMHHSNSMNWQPSPSDMVTATQATFPAVPGPYNPAPNASSFEGYESYKPRLSPESMTPPHHFSPATLYSSDPYGAGSRMHGQVPTASTSSTGYSQTYATPASNSPQTLENENRMLRKKLREMEARCHQSDEQLRSFTGGMQLAQPSLTAATSSSSHNSPPLSPTFQAQWNARTEARIRLFCSLNRAGNALCAWHDSRRERRAYPPRNAPPGYLNCGCTYEEALFEESLARHNVGSYHPGENVRMDPALRNPLLRLLQERYGYRDGDFERDSHSGRWTPEEGASVWEQKVHAGVRGKARSDRSERNGSQ